MENHPSPIYPIDLPEAKARGIEVSIKRDDLIHPTIMGNKWRKLKYNLQAAQQQGCDTLLTFGGAFSNHIQATAIAAKEYGFKSVGIIRGDELTPKSNPTLREANKNSMILKFVSREDFRVLKKDFSELLKEYPTSYILPEGGTNSLAIKGAAEIIDEIPSEQYNFIICPFGTGGTMAGILSSLPTDKKVIGISSLKGHFVYEEFNRLCLENDILNSNYEIILKYHFGGYAKTNSQLITFINNFKVEYGIALDPIYTGKMFFAVWDLIKGGYFPKDSKVIIVHTGGLQGIVGFNEHRGKVIL